eukprot:TRINITY_DN6369_c0_g1_i1.p1 TRINITY_DN6369_c0_g1~~TRINITY_DN6369_c0_g1_i1.p1  ORF type:complete len:190 (-),score=32.67 TRINITY_DN6369_c0_g1_i1:137-706(-)
MNGCIHSWQQKSKDGKTSFTAATPTGSIGSASTTHLGDLFLIPPRFGTCYWIDSELLAKFSSVIRRQMKDFTTPEVVRLANAMSRLGGTDDVKYVGMFFEMRQRVHLPFVDKYIREKLRDPAGLKTGVPKYVEKMLPKGSKLKKQLKTSIPRALAMAERKMLKQADLDVEESEEFKPEWHDKDFNDYRK